ncbi:MAG: tape measure protein [Thiotrichales bacterium]
MAIRQENLIANFVLHVDRQSVAQAERVRNTVGAPIESEVKLDIDEGSVRDIERKIEQVAQKLANISPDNDLFEPLSKELNGLQKQLEGTVRKIEQAGKQSNQSNRQIGGFAAGLRNLAAAGAAIGIAEILRQGTVQAVNLAAELETTTQKFAVFLGSEDEAVRLLTRLNEISESTPFEPEQLESAARLLLSFGGTAQTVQQDIVTLGELSSATGANLEDLALVFGQVQAKQKLQGEEALQLLERGIPVYELLSKELGKSQAEIQKLQSEGAISFETLRKALTNATREGGKFAGSLERQSQTLNGLRSTLSGVGNAILRAFGERILEPVKSLTREAISFGKALLGIVQVPLSEKLREQQSELNSLVTALTSANISEAERSRIITEINDKFPEFLENTDLQTASEQELRTALKQANAEFEARIVLQQLNEAIQKNQERLQEQLNKQVESTLDLTGSLAEAEQLLGVEINGVNDALQKLSEVDQTAQVRRLQREIVAFNLSRRRETGFVNDAQEELNATQAEQADQIEVIKRAFPELFAELERIRKGAEDVAASPGGGTGLDKDKIKAQVGSVAAIQAQITKLNKTIQNTAANAPEQLGYAEELARLQEELTVAQRLLANLLNPERLGVNITLPGIVPFDPGLSPQREDIAELEAQLQQRLRAQELSQARAELEAVGNEDQLTEIRLQGLRERRQILLESGVASGEDFIDLAIQIAQAEFDIEEAKTEKAREENEKRRDLARETGEVLIGLADDILENQLANVDAQIRVQEQRRDEILQIADRGNAEQLQLEEERLRRLTEEREKYVRTQRQLAASQLAIENALAVAGVIRLISTSTNPVDIALRSVLVAATIASTVANLAGAFSDIPSFYKGTEEVPGATTQGRLIEVHGRERVLTAAQNAPLLKMGVKNEDVAPLVRMGLIASSARIPTSLLAAKQELETEQLRLDNKRLLTEQKKTNKLLSTLKVSQNIDARGVSQMVETQVKRIERRKNLRR